MIVLIKNSRNERINNKFENQPGIKLTSKTSNIFQDLYSEPKVSRQKRSLTLFKSFMDSMFKTKSKSKYLVDDEENIVNVVKVLIIIRLFC